ncbi:hypothetical protein GPOL_c07710 [Gordonia polyisoprenivorans VH2]|uniref:Uncharacterized protein n=1 Tax=Gordonia polyisoprenivorans (strain DSM 44266 / VH2) TaxID=1112204 RepID=H6MXR9_GORPV|nr:hypothetical protein [Gordonia polyisoprenivorans]AFA71839.1 hypothetical protein GPOL_c07710 [Gordonia polyisoprenivorans VH2]
MGRHSLVREPATRRVALGATALAASATLTAGLAFGDGQAQASIPQVTSGLASIHDWSTATLDEVIAALGIESQGIAGGVALGPNYLIQQLTDLLNVPGLDAEEIKEILSLVGINFGNELAIALLPGVAAAIPLGAGSSAAALSILGVALATDGVTNISNSIWDYELLGLIPVAPILEAFGIDRADLPDDMVFCLGALAAANSKTAGSCLNIAATFDARYIKVADGQQSGEVQLALTNPLSVLTLLTDQDQLLDILAQAITGDPIYVTKDVLRLSLNGPENLALTSDYGFSGPITISWLGSQFVLFPGTAQTHGTNGPDYVNYLSLPTLTLGTPTSLQQIIPTFDVSSFNFFDLFTIPAFNTGNLTSASPTSATVPVSALRSVQPELMSVSAADAPTTDTPTTDAPTTDAGDGGQTAGAPASTNPAAAPAAGDSTLATGSTDTDQAAPQQDTPIPAPVVTTPAGQADAGDQAGGATGDQGASNTAPITDDSSLSTPSSSPAVGSATTGGTGASTVSDQQQPAA